MDDIVVPDIYQPPVVEGFTVEWEDIPVSTHGLGGEHVALGRKVLKHPYQHQGCFAIQGGKEVVRPKGSGLWWPHLPDDCCGDHKSAWMFRDQLLICQGCGLDCT